MRQLRSRNNNNNNNNITRSHLPYYVICQSFLILILKSLTFICGKSILYKTVSFKAQYKHQLLNPIEWSSWVGGICQVSFGSHGLVSAVSYVIDTLESLMSLKSVKGCKEITILSSFSHPCVISNLWSKVFEPKKNAFKNIKESYHSKTFIWHFLFCGT